MIGRRAIVGLSLLSALLFCALAAEGASAAAHTSENTTAFTCVKKEKKEFVFEDAHCDKKSPNKTGQFEHELIPAESTTIEVTNKETKNATTEHTPAVLKGEVLKVKTEISCTKVESTKESGGKKSTIKNTGTAPDHKVEGTVIVDFSECTVKNPAKCFVEEPIEVKSEFMGVDKLNETAAEKNMGLEFAGDGSAIFVILGFTGPECAIKGAKPEVTGTAIATGNTATGIATKESGATAVFSPEKEMQTLSLGGKPATFEGAFTTRMVGGNPITLTTAT